MAPTQVTMLSAVFPIPHGEGGGTCRLPAPEDVIVPQLSLSLQDP